MGGDYHAVVPEHGEAAAKCPLCGAVLDASNTSTLMDKTVVHVGCLKSTGGSLTGAAVESPKAPLTADGEAALAAAVAEIERAARAVAATAPLELYLDCYPDGVAAARLEPYVEGLCREVEHATGAADVRCGPKDGPLGFGGWRGVLAAAARDRPPAPGAYLASSSSELALVVFDALAPRAVRVVRGSR